MAAMTASTMAVLGAAQVSAVSNGNLASRSSVSFNNGGLPSMAFVRARSVRSLTVRAIDVPDDAPGSSTGGITDKARELAEKTASVFDGAKQNVEETLTDGGRNLKSKTGDVVYKAQRNAEGVGADAQKKAEEAQTKFTKGKE